MNETTWLFDELKSLCQRPPSKLPGVMKDEIRVLVQHYREQCKTPEAYEKSMRAALRMFLELWFDFEGPYTEHCIDVEERALFEFLHARLITKFGGWQRYYSDSLDKGWPEYALA